MPTSALDMPQTDPLPLFDLLRAQYSTDLLAAAVKLGVFDQLAAQPLSLADLGGKLNLAERPMHVLVTALRAMRLLERAADGSLGLTPISREHLVTGEPFDISGYASISGAPGAVAFLLERLTSNSPAGIKPAEQGAAYIYRAGMASAMEAEASARRLTLALAGRARNVAPYLARTIDLTECKVLVDVAGGTGLYLISCLQANPHLRGVVFDRPEVLKIASEFATEFGVADRMECVVGDMFTDPIPKCDGALLSNVLHDWDVPENEMIIARCVESLNVGGAVHVHDVFLDDDLGGPLGAALFSAALFVQTEGRAYSGVEYAGWLSNAGLAVEPSRPTFMGYSLLSGRKV